MRMSESKSAEARAFAVKAHGDQKYGTQPYSVHLDAVAELVADYGEEAKVVAYLHDVVEDTDVTVDEIRTRFGERVAFCVCLLSDEPGVNRRERKARTNEKLTAIPSEYELVLVVKAADRLANLRESVKGADGSKLEMYRREHDAFREAVYRDILCCAFWDEMDAILAGTTAP